MTNSTILMKRYLLAVLVFFLVNICSDLLFIFKLNYVSLLSCKALYSVTPVFADVCVTSLICVWACHFANEVFQITRELFEVSSCSSFKFHALLIVLFVSIKASL